MIELTGNKGLASAAFIARVVRSVAHNDPEAAWAGLTEDQAKARGIKVKKGLFLWTASGRAIANGRDEGVPNCCLTTAQKQDQVTAMLAGATAKSWAAAWSAPMRAT